MKRSYQLLLALVVSVITCSVAAVATVQASVRWWQANCVSASPSGPVCHLLAIYNAWWWLALLVAIPALTIGLYAFRGGRSLG